MVRCPNYRAPKSKYYCSVCYEGIYENEEYVENAEGDYAHYDCLTGMTSYELIKWAGCSVRIMGEN
jgi:hypothetical protein